MIWFQCTIYLRSAWLLTSHEKNKRSQNDRSVGWGSSLEVSSPPPVFGAGQPPTPDQSSPGFLQPTLGNLQGCTFYHLSRYLFQGCIALLVKQLLLVSSLYLLSYILCPPSCLPLSATTRKSLALQSWELLSRTFEFLFVRLNKLSSLRLSL